MFQCIGEKCLGQIVGQNLDVWIEFVAQHDRIEIIQKIEFDIAHGVIQKGAGHMNIYLLQILEAGCDQVWGLLLLVHRKAFIPHGP